MADIDIRVLGPGDEALLLGAAPDLFDNPVEPGLAQAFLEEPSHRIAVAIDAGVVVGFASGVRYVHPDKPWSLWINEVGVAPTHRRRGLAACVVRALLGSARQAGCAEAWVGTERSNAAAIALYEAVGGEREGDEEFLAFWFPIDP
jgi:ribosomal protein S18 acetylase RimI-like enzyme